MLELHEKIIEEVFRRVGRISMSSPMDKVEEAMRGISRSPFSQWIMKEVKPRNLSPSMLEKF